MTVTDQHAGCSMPLTSPDAFLDCAGRRCRKRVALRAGRSGAEACRSAISDRHFACQRDRMLPDWYSLAALHERTDASCNAGGADHWIVRGVHYFFRFQPGDSWAVWRGGIPESHGVRSAERDLFAACDLCRNGRGSAASINNDSNDCKIE